MTNTKINPTNTTENTVEEPAFVMTEKKGLQVLEVKNTAFVQTKPITFADITKDNLEAIFALSFLEEEKTRRTKAMCIYIDGKDESGKKGTDWKDKYLAYGMEKSTISLYFRIAKDFLADNTKSKYAVRNADFKVATLMYFERKSKGIEAAFKTILERDHEKEAYDKEGKKIDFDLYSIIKKFLEWKTISLADRPTDVEQKIAKALAINTTGEDVTDDDNKDGNAEKETPKAIAWYDYATDKPVEKPQGEPLEVNGIHFTVVFDDNGKPRLTAYSKA